MQVISLQNLPRQELNVTLDGMFYDITLVAIQDCMYATIMANNALVISGIRCVAQMQLLPYDYLEGQGGNFIFATQNNELPWWENFGNTQQLLYATVAELEAIRVGV